MYKLKELTSLELDLSYNEINETGAEYILAFTDKLENMKAIIWLFGNDNISESFIIKYKLNNYVIF